MESLSLSHSVVNNLNQAFDEHAKINRHLQTGKRVMHASDDVGEASKLGKTKMDLIKNRKIQGNLQNSLSLLQAQDGMFKVIGNILDRSSELKIRFDSPVANSAEKEAYNKEFTELQGELRSIAQSKWNGISLFSTQDSRTLFGAPVDTPDLLQESNESGSDAPLKLSRWGIYHHVPRDESTPLNKKLLAMTFTDESQGGGGGYYDSPAAADEARFAQDITNWKNFTSSLGIDAEIAIVVNQVSNIFGQPFGSGALGGHVLPPSYVNETTELQRLATEGVNASIHRGAGRDNMNQGLMPDGGDPNDHDDQAEFLFSIFQQKTNNGADLPDALGIFVDNSGSLSFDDVNQGLFKFIDRVRATYPQVILPSDNLTLGDPLAIDQSTDPMGEGIQSGNALGDIRTGVFRGVSLAGAEDWIEQSQGALQNLIDNDPTFQAALLTDQEAPTLALSSYTQAELVGFLDTLTQARGQNAAEQQRIRSEIEELQGRVVGLEQSIEVGEGLDIPMAMGVFHKTKDRVDLNAQLVAAAKDMENVLYTDFL